VNEDLVYDVGMHNGDDTALYLSQGFRVVAIEANPVLAETGRTRFASALAAGQLEILNIGVAACEGAFDFWVNEENDEYSSFVEEVGCRNGSRCHAITVPCLSFRQILDRHGVPYYLKIDIERGDVHCLTGLDRADLPRYVSVEAHSLEYLCILSRLGYDGFKCIDQLSHNFPGYRPDNESLRGRLTSGWLHAWREFSRRCLRHRPTANGRHFPIGSSGPFGEETPGEWQSLEEVAYSWLHFKMGHRKRGRLNMRGWFDFHATILPADECGQG
jgi:FkbM family methyltransferase